MKHERMEEIKSYFENGCLCILSGKLNLATKDMPYEEAVNYYEEMCTCSRNYKHLEKTNEI